MKKIMIKKLLRESEKHLDQEVKISGWIRTIRDSKTFGFIELNDGSFFKGLQVVFEEGLSNFEEICKLSLGSSLTVTGKIVRSQGGKQDIEMQAQEIKIIQKADVDFPLQKKRHSFEFLRTIAHLRPRTNTFSAVFRLRSVLSQSIHNFFQEKGFVWVHTPIISASDCEGAGEMFQVTTLPLHKVPQKDGEVDFKKDFFGKKAGLTVSGQLNVETFAMAFQNVYTFGPTFRAENSNTSRHASEFWMIEPEIAFADIHDDMDLAEEMIKYIIKDILEKLPEEMEFFNQFIDKGLLARLQSIIKADFERITYTQAIDILKKSSEKFEFPVSWGRDLQSEHEQYLCKKLGKPVFVTGYPKEIKAFYMRINDDQKTVAAMDLLVPGIGEIIGGSQREERLEVLDQRIKDLGLDPEDYGWYRDTRRFGGVEHAGFGLGFERMIMYMTGMTNIRDVIPFPRTPKNCDF